MKLNQKSPLPLHAQLSQIIEKRVQEGYYTEQIPSERELMDEYNVSRSTVREAVSTLVQEGILEKRHGRGTFVSDRPVQEWLSITNFTEIAKHLDITLLDYKKVATPSNLKSIDDFQGQCYYIIRLRSKNQIPVAIESHYYPIEIGEKLIHYDLTQAVLYDVLERDLNFQFWDAEQIVTCEQASQEDADILQADPSNLSLLTTERMMYDANGQLIEYYKGKFLSDMYSFRMKMSRRHSIQE
ncbi:GntR family transcriptional regulator [Tuberibacillus sp. Marseille-P3662]|uniref:GntR family transcriptional regulator n=1 Tax=Tuberibacillus sp. Marseille-P3662 TaxID=1965358 RepID=UPI000A1CD234|nr:GntR family transcriptional regulator [Tuberibacillus sp. Marseille-P3662]